MIRIIIGLVLSVTAFYLLGGFGSKDDEELLARTKDCIANFPAALKSKYGDMAVNADCLRAVKEDMTGVKSSAKWNIP